MSFPADFSSPPLFLLASYIFMNKKAVLEPLYVSDDAPSAHVGQNKGAMGNAEKGDRFHADHDSL